MSDNSSRKLGDEAIIVMGQSPAGETCNRFGGGNPLLNGPTEFGSHHPYPVQFTTEGKKFSKPNDILFCVRGSTTGRMNWSDRIYAIGRGIAAIRHKTTPALQPLVRAIIEFNLPQLLQSATGSTFPNVSASQLAEIPFPDISIEDSEAFASILGALDDKIDLNRRMNETLETMARVIFKDWFVDFGPTRAKMEGNQPYLAPEIWALFPDRLDEAGMPEGWSDACISDFCNVKSGKRPPTKMSLPDSDNEVPVYGGNGVSWYTNSSLFEPPFIITGRVGTLGTVFRVYEKVWVSDNALCCFPLRIEYLEYLYFVLSGLDFSSLNSGSTQPLLTQTVLSKQTAINVGDEIICAFSEMIQLLFLQVEKNCSENQSLRQTRDLLLPKLMSGEIRAVNADVTDLTED